MSASLGGAPLGQIALGRRPLASSSVPMVLVRQVITSLTGSLVVPEDVLADLFAYGAGASGASVPVGGGPGGGGGGAAGYSRLLIPARAVLSWTGGTGGTTVGGTGSAVAGIDGTDATISVNGRLIGTAQGGRAGTTTGAAARSTATGFQVNRYGGGAGEAGEFGGSSSGSGYGGGPGGFSDLFGSVIPASGGAPTGGFGLPTSAGFGAGGGGGPFHRYSGPGGFSLIVANLYRFA